MKLKNILRKPGKSLARVLATIKGADARSTPLTNTPYTTVDAPTGVGTDELHNDLGGRDAASCHPAAAIDYTPPVGSHLVAAEVQAAIDELDAEKLAIDGTMAMAGDLDFDHHSAVEMLFDHGAAFPALPVAGQVFWRTDLLALYVYDAGGATWVAIGGGGAHNILSATHSDTTAAALVQGDILVADATPKLVRKAAAMDGSYLSILLGLVDWVQNLLPAVDITYDIGSSSMRWANGYFQNPSNVPGGLGYTHYYHDINRVGLIGALESNYGYYFMDSDDGLAHTSQRGAGHVSALCFMPLAPGTITCNDDAAHRSHVWIWPGVTYNTPGNEAFHRTSYFSSGIVPATLVHDELWSGATRNDYCGTATIIAAVAPAMESVAVAFANVLPDTKYAVQLTGCKLAGVGCDYHQVPGGQINIAVEAELAAGSKAIGGFTITALFKVTSAATNALVGVWDNYAALVAALGVIAPHDALNATGLDKVDWLLRRYY